MTEGTPEPDDAAPDDATSGHAAPDDAASGHTAPDEAASGHDLPAMRASDIEREHTVTVLQQSFSEGRLTLAEFDDRTTSAYAAVFRSDLDALTRDLAPAHRPDSPAPTRSDESRPRPRPQDTPPARRVTGESGPQRSLALLGGVERTGPWTVPTTHTVATVMGGGSLDLTRAGLQSHEVTLTVFALMGGIEIMVPDDVRLDVDGVGIMGYFGEDTEKHKGADLVREAPPGAPRVRVTGLALWGGVSVRRVPRT